MGCDVGIRGCVPIVVECENQRTVGWWWRSRCTSWSIGGELGKTDVIYHTFVEPIKWRWLSHALSDCQLGGYAIRIVWHRI